MQRMAEDRDFAVDDSAERDDGDREDADIDELDAELMLEREEDAEIDVDEGLFCVLFL